MRKIAFILNGKLNWQKVHEKLQAAFATDYQIESFITQPNVSGTVLTLTAIQSGFTHIICVGGDGTLNEVANGIMQSKEFITNALFNELRLGVLPYGSGNDFAKSINTRFDLYELKGRIDQDQQKKIDLGLVTFKDHSGSEARRYFINITDVGLGGIVVKHVNSSPKWFGPFLAYQWAIVKSLIFYRHQQITAIADSKVYNGKILNYIIANGKYFGSGLAIAPDAKPDDGVFSLVIVGKVSLLFYLKSLSDIKKGKHIKHPEVFYEQAKDISIESDEPHPIDMDGEYIGSTPVKIVMTEKAIKFLC